LTGPNSTTTSPGGRPRPLLTLLVDLDWVRRSKANRAAQITDTGRGGLSEVSGAAARRRHAPCWNNLDDC